MKTGKRIRVCIDMVMIILLPFLMAYSLVGETAHEWMGIGMFFLFILHHVINHAWLKMIFRVRQYTKYRIYCTIVNLLLLFIMFFLPVSGIMMSKHLFHFSEMSDMAFVRKVHLLLAYWGFILMSVHIGNHAGKHMQFNKAGNACRKYAICLLRAIFGMVSCYGIYVFVHRNIGAYLFLKEQFVFFDYSQPTLYFIADYAAMICLFASVGYFITRMLQQSIRGNLKNE